MIIGVDAGAIAVTDPRLRVGVYHVTKNLLREISILDTKNSYRLYSFTPIPADIMKSFGPNMKNIVLRPSSGYMKFWLPLELARRPVDVFLGLSQAVPKTSARTIGLIYDLGFIHDPAKYTGSSDRLKKQTASLVSSSDHIVTISKSSKEDIVSTFPEITMKVSYAYPGIDPRYTPESEKYASDKPYFLYVGSLKKSKNIPLLLRSFAEFLASSKKQYNLYLVGGDYWMDEEILSVINQLRLKNNVRIVGFVHDELLPSFYRGATVFVTMSQWEGFCLPAAESLASGIPVIYVKSGALPEVVGDAGIGIDTFDHIAFAHALHTYTSQVTLQKTLRNSTHKQSKNFSWRSFASHILKTFDV